MVARSDDAFDTFDAWFDKLIRSLSGLSVDSACDRTGSTGLDSRRDDFRRFREDLRFFLFDDDQRSVSCSSVDLLNACDLAFLWCVRDDSAFSFDVDQRSRNFKVDKLVFRFFDIVGNDELRFELRWPVMSKMDEMRWWM